MSQLTLTILHFYPQLLTVALLLSQKIQWSKQQLPLWGTQRSTDAYLDMN